MYRNKTEESIKSEMLLKVSNTIDRSENSIVHDMLSPAALELANVYLALTALDEKRDIDNLKGWELEQYVAQRTGIERKRATHATATVKIVGEEGIQIPAWKTVVSGTLKFVILQAVEISELGEVFADVECEIPGSQGNVPNGAIDRFSEPIAGVAYVSNLEPAVGGYDDESDDDLRFRYYEKIRTPATSGNVYHYTNWAKEVVGVGDVLVTPRWNGNGTVKLVVVDSNKEVPSAELMGEVYAHIEGNRPIGAEVTVVGATYKALSVSANVALSTSVAIQDIKLVFESKLEEYSDTLVFKGGYISVAKIGSILLGIDGVEDYNNLTLNGVANNAILTLEEIPKFTVALGMVI